MGFKLTTLVVKDIDCIDSSKSNNHTITATTLFINTKEKGTNNDLQNAMLKIKDQAT
jgi:hypothetical protein